MAQMLKMLLTTHLWLPEVTIRLLYSRQLNTQIGEYQDINLHHQTSGGLLPEAIHLLAFNL